VQDADNLGWKLAAALQGKAGLIESYNQERSEAADENILNSTRATDFIAPRQKAEARFRNAALALARQTEFGKRFVNSGRLSTPTAYYDSSLSTPDDGAWLVGPLPGAPIPDAPLGDGYLSERLGHGFALLRRPDAKEALPVAGLTLIEATEGDGTLIQRFDLASGSAYLIRPDRHVAARFRSPEHTIALTALRRAGGA